MTQHPIIEHYVRDMRAVMDRLPIQDITRTIDRLFEAWRNGRRVFVMGNGGSASTASHFVCDLNKAATVNGKARLKGISLTDNVSWMSALTNDIGWEHVYTEQLKNLMETGDVVMAITVHGGSRPAPDAAPGSQNLLSALQYARSRGGITLGLAGVDGGPLTKWCDVCIVVPSPSVPLVESLHVAIHHLICLCLRERIAQHS